MGGLFGELLGGWLGSGAGGISDTASALISFFGTITDGKMWRSLGWLILGLLMMMMGINFLLKDQQLALVGSVAKAVA